MAARTFPLTGTGDATAAVEFGSGVLTADTQRVVIATDQPAVPTTVSAALPAGTNNIGDVDVLTLPALPAGTNNIGDVDVLSLPALPAGTNNIGDVDVLSVPADPFGANADAASSSGSMSAKLRFIAATGIPVTSLPALPAGSNNIGDVDVLTLPAIPAGGNTIGNVNQAGTWTVQPGNTPNTTAWLVSERPATSGGLTTFHLVGAATTNATVVKASAGQVYGWYIYNANAAMRKVAFHNTATTPTAGASIFFTLCIPPTSAANVTLNTGIAFSSGIAITTVTGFADSDATAIGATDLNINIFYA